MRLRGTLHAGRRYLIAGLMGWLWGCSTTPYVPATPARRLPPVACQTVCPPVPELQDGSLAGLRRWASDVLDLYHDCRRAHSACMDDLEQE